MYYLWQNKFPDLQKLTLLELFVCLDGLDILTYFFYLKWCNESNRVPKFSTRYQKLTILFNNFILLKLDIVYFVGMKEWILLAWINFNEFFPLQHELYAYLHCPHSPFVSRNMCYFSLLELILNCCFCQLILIELLKCFCEQNSTIFANST